MLPSSELLELRNDNRRSLGISDYLEDDIISVALKIFGMRPLPRIPVELCGTFAYQLAPNNVNKAASHLSKEPPVLCVRTSPEGRNGRYIELSSNVVFSNNTYTNLRIFGIKLPGKAPSEDEILNLINKKTAKPK